MTNAERLKKIRTHLGLNQTEMAKKMGYSHQQTISNIEKGWKQMGNQALKILEMIEKSEAQ